MRPGIVWNKSKALYLTVVNANGQYWNTGTQAFEDYAAVHWANYVFTVTDPNALGTYDRASIAGPADGAYRFDFYQQAGGSPATSDAPAVWTETKQLTSGVWVEATSAAAPTLVITPVQANAANPRYSSRILAPIAKGTAPVDIVTVTDGAGAAVDLTGRSLRMTFGTKGCATAPATGIHQYTTGGGGLTVQGDDGNQVRIQHSVALTRTIGPGAYRWWLFDMTGGEDAKILLVKGTVEVEDAVESVS